MWEGLGLELGERHLGHQREQFLAAGGPGRVGGEIPGKMRSVCQDPSGKLSGRLQ